MMPMDTPSFTELSKCQRLMIRPITESDYLIGVALELICGVQLFVTDLPEQLKRFRVVIFFVYREACYHSDIFGQDANRRRMGSKRLPRSVLSD